MLLLLELLLMLLLLLLLLYAFYHVLIRGREAPPYDSIRIFSYRDSAVLPPALLVWPAFRSLVRSAALDWLKNMRAAGCVALWLRFFARTWPLGLDFGRSDGPWARFSKPKRLFFRCSCVRARVRSDHAAIVLRTH